VRGIFGMEALPGYEPEIGRWSWALERVRHRTLQLVDGLSQQLVDWEGPAGCENAIGSLLYHIALVEMSWLFMDVLEQDLPGSLQIEFPHPMATEGRITHVLSVPAEEHVERLNRCRSLFLEALHGMTWDDWRRLRKPEDVNYEVSPAWAVFHLIEHEAGHAAQISTSKERATRFFAAEGKPGLNAHPCRGSA